MYKWIGHIEVYFTDEERDSAIASIEGRAPDFEDILTRLTQQGVGVKFTYSEATDQYRVTLQPKDKHCPYVGYTLGFSHIEMTRLLLIAEYIYEVMVERHEIPIPEKGQVNDW